MCVRIAVKNWNIQWERSKPTKSSCDDKNEQKKNRMSSLVQKIKVASWCLGMGLIQRADKKTQKAKIIATATTLNIGKLKNVFLYYVTFVVDFFFFFAANTKDFVIVLAQKKGDELCVFPPCVCLLPSVLCLFLVNWPWCIYFEILWTGTAIVDTDDNQMCATVLMAYIKLGSWLIVKFHYSQHKIDLKLNILTNVST